MNYVYLNGKIYLIPDGKSINNTLLFPRTPLSHTVRELYEMRDENIVWNELFVYDDIESFIDYNICINI